MNQPNQLGQQLRSLREGRGWTVRHAAEIAGVTEGTWRLYEKGARSVGNGLTVPVNYQAATIRAMASALEADVEPLLTLAAQAPGPSAEAVSDVVRAILEDPFLLPEAREHLVRQYGLLLRVGSSATPEQQAAAVDAQGVTDIRSRPRKTAAKSALDGSSKKAPVKGPAKRR